MPRDVNKRPRVVAIVQARMGSTRLPGKVLRLIAGKPLLWHVIHRLRRCHSLDAIAIATSTNARDDAIESFGRDADVAVVRGPEDDVLARFALAAEATGAGVILRVASDAPFLDASFIDRLIETLIAEDADYVMLKPGAVCAHGGVDPFSRRALDKLMIEARDDEVAREHVTGYFKLHPDFVKIAWIDGDPRFAKAGARLTVDTPDDLALAEAVHERLAAKAGEASLADLLLLLEREPKLAGMNAHVRQKELGAKGGLVLIRCDGGGALGYGHVKRMTILARAFRDHEGLGVLFALHGDEKAAEPLRAAGFETLMLPPGQGASALEDIVTAHHPDALVCDLREGLARGDLARLAAMVSATAVIDDGSERRLAASHAYYAPVPQARALAWDGAGTCVRIGWEWALTGIDVHRGRRRAGVPLRPQILVSMGGSDPFDLTRLAARALATLPQRFLARFVIGPGFRDRAALSREIEAFGSHFTTIADAQDLAGEYANADLALCAFGVTAYELAAMGVPALYIAISEDHALSASAFEHAGMGVLLGNAEALRPEDIARAAEALLASAERRTEMRISALATLDGNGAARIAADIAGAIETARLRPAAARA